MLDSASTVHLDQARFIASSHALAERLAALTARRHEVGNSVDALLLGWHGEAAATFTTLWESWRDSADQVIDDLRRAIGALALAAADLRSADQVAVGESARLHGRLG